MPRITKGSPEAKAWGERMKVSTRNSKKKAAAPPPKKNDFQKFTMDKKTFGMPALHRMATVAHPYQHQSS